MLDSCVNPPGRWIWESHDFSYEEKRFIPHLWDLVRRLATRMRRVSAFLRRDTTRNTTRSETPTAQTEVMIWYQKTPAWDVNGAMGSRCLRLFLQKAINVPGNQRVAAKLTKSSARWVRGFADGDDRPSRAQHWLQLHQVKTLVASPCC